MTRFSRKIFLLAVAAFSGCLAAARADLTMVQKVEGLGEDYDNTSRFKGTKTRVDTSPGTSLIVDLKSGEIVTLMHAPKTYFKASDATTRAAFDRLKSSPSDSPASKPVLTATGKTDKISGHAAAEYTCTVGGKAVTLWLTKALPDYEAALKEMSGPLQSGPVGPLLQSDGLDMASLPGFPIRTVILLKSGKTMTRTVVAVDTKPVPDAEFEIPADYKEIATPVLTPPAAAQPSPDSH